MSSFIALRKSFDLNADGNTRMLVGRQNRRIPALQPGGAVVTALKKHYDFTATVKFDTAGGSSCDPQKYKLGQTYETLPVTTRVQHVFNGWFTQPTGGRQIFSSSVVELSNTILYAQWDKVAIAADCTEYIAQATASYKNTGIYTAGRYSSTSAIYVDWGDGTVAKINGDISALTHTYATAGTYHVKVSNNITSFGPNTDASNWYDTASNNRYTFDTMVKTGSRLTSNNAMPSRAFTYCGILSSIDWLSSCYTGVTAIPDSAFRHCDMIKSISSLPGRIKSLGVSAFADCVGLTGVQDLRNTALTDLPKTGIFYNCINVHEWKLPATLTAQYFGTYMFCDNTALSAIELPSTLTVIPAGCFRRNSNLKNISIPEKIYAIDGFAFEDCTTLSSIDWQTTALTSIKANAFAECTALKDVNTPNTTKIIEPNAFRNCRSVNASALVLPSALTSLGPSAFYGCHGLKSLSIPSGLSAMADYAFAGCYNLSSITDYRLTAQIVSANTFGQMTSLMQAGGYVGYATHGTGGNTLCVYAEAEGYDDGFWADPLQNSAKCGFQLKYIDPENVKYCDVMFNAGDGTVEDQSIYVKTLKQHSTLALPTPTCPEATPYFIGWYTGPNGAGMEYTAGSKVPVQSELTLYALYATKYYTVDLNDQWRVSETQANPDPNAYDGVYESNSNYNIHDSFSKMYVRLLGCTDFTLYIRCNTESESRYDYALAMDLDVDVTTTPYYGSIGVKASTYGKSSAETGVADYVKVEYTGIDGGNHFICIVYRKDSVYSAGDDRGYLLIPKNQ